MASYLEASNEAFGPPPGQQAQAQVAQAQPQAGPVDDVWSRHFHELPPSVAATVSGQGQASDEALAGLTGDDFLKALAKQEPAKAAMIRNIGEGKQPYPTGFIMKTPYGQRLVDYINQAYPGMDSTQFATRQAQRKNYMGGGKQFREMQAIGTVSGHLQNLMTSADALDNFQNLGPLNAPVNSVVQTYREMNQDPRLTKFNIDKQAVANELQKAYTAGHITDTQLHSWQQNINAAQSPPQLRAAIGELNDLLESKRRILDEGFQRTMGDIPKPEEWRTESQRVSDAFKRVSDWAGGNGRPPAAGGAAPAAPAPGNYIYDPAAKRLVPAK